MKHSVRVIVTAGLLIALDVISARFLRIYTPGNADRLSAQFLPNALGGLMFGAPFAALICALGDVVGMLTNSDGMVFMPLITLACASRGLIYGLVLHKRPLSFWRCFAAVAIVTTAVELLLMPWFLSILYGRGFIELLLIKLPYRIAGVPVYASLLYAVGKGLKSSGILRGRTTI